METLRHKANCQLSSHGVDKFQLIHGIRTEQRRPGNEASSKGKTVMPSHHSNFHTCSTTLALPNTTSDKY